MPVFWRIGPFVLERLGLLRQVVRHVFPNLGHHRDKTGHRNKGDLADPAKTQ